MLFFPLDFLCLPETVTYRFVRHAVLTCSALVVLLLLQVLFENWWDSLFLYLTSYQLCSLWYLLSNDISSLRGVWALVDDIADLLVTQQEVYAVGGQSQEGVVGVLDLQRQNGRSGSPAFVFQARVWLETVCACGTSSARKLLFVSHAKRKGNVKCRNQNNK